MNNVHYLHGLVGNRTAKETGEIDNAINLINGEIIVGDTFDKLAELESTKLAIEIAIENAGLDIPSGTKFADYPTFISLLTLI